MGLFGTKIGERARKNLRNYNDLNDSCDAIYAWCSRCQGAGFNWGWGLSDKSIHAFEKKCEDCNGNGKGWFPEKYFSRHVIKYNFDFDLLNANPPYKDYHPSKERQKSQRGCSHNWQVIHGGSEGQRRAVRSVCKICGQTQNL